MMGLCRGLAYQAIVEAAKEPWRERWFGWWQSNETFGVIPSRAMVGDCFRDDPATYFPVSFRYLELLDECPLRMQHPSATRE
jgi:hypothetical protein